MITQRPNTIGRRAGQFLEEIFPGPHKDKRLAQHLGVSSNMASLLRRGQSWTIDRLDQVRDLHGWDFVRYVFEAPEPDFAALRATLQTVLEQLPAKTAELISRWFDDSGGILNAPNGHADFVRRRLGLSVHVQGDLVASICRNRGWVALTLDRTAQVIVQHHATAIAPDAARSCRDWLTNHASQIGRVKRLVEVDGTIAEVDHDGAVAAATAIGIVAQAKPSGRIPFAAERRPLDEAPDDMGQIIAVFCNSPDDVIAAAFAAGLMPTCSILTVRGSSVTNDFMGSDIPLDRSEIVGKNVLDRSDPAYGAFVHAQILAARDQPTLTEVRGTAYGLPLHYIRAAIPAGNSQVLSIARPLIRRSC